MWGVSEQSRSIEAWDFHDQIVGVTIKSTNRLPIERQPTALVKPTALANTLTSKAPELTIPEEDNSKRGRESSEFAIVMLLLLTLTICMFWRVLFGAETVAFRDAGHYYYPFYQAVQNSWATGLPLWNDLEQIGRPLMADPTAAAFYPGKLIFILPMDYSRAYNLFIVGHVFLSALTSFAAARGFGCTVPASGFCAIGYAFSGPIVFQYCNAVFLIGASWFPMAFWLSYRLNMTPNLKNLLKLSCVYSIIILGGDVQTVYHAMLVQLVFLWSFRTETNRAMRWRSLGWSSLAVALSICWTAGQFLPSLEWAAASNRAEVREPRNVYELGIYWTKNNDERAGNATEAFWNKPTSGSHRDKTYQFSIGPWRWVELLWPNFSGRLLPENRRWLNAIPAEGRVWAPTLYAGILVVLFSFCADGRRKEARWLRLLVILSALSSLGTYGFGWLANELMLLLGRKAEFWGPVGGLHWFMNLFLPFFNLFRYPAKIWTLTSLALSLLAAFGMDRVAAGSPWPAKLVKRLSLCSLAGLLLGYAFKAHLLPLWRNAPIDTLLGPLDRQGAFEDLTHSFLHTLLVLVGFATAYHVLRTKRKSFALAIVLLLAVDIFVANRWTILSVESSTWKREAPLANAIRRHAKETHQQSTRTMRCGAPTWYPSDWSKAGNRSRIQQCVNWDRQTLKPKHGLLDGIQVVNGKGSFSDARIERLLLEANGELPPTKQLNEFGIRYVIAPMEQLNSQDDWDVIFEHRIENQKLGVGYNKDATPDAWIGKLSEATIQRIPEAEQCVVSRHSATEVVVVATLDSPATIVLNDFYAPGWVGEVEKLHANLPKKQAQVVPIHDLFRGITLDSAGEYRIVFRYAPKVVYLGLYLSLFSMGAAMLFIAVAWLWHRDTKFR